MATAMVTPDLRAQMAALRLAAPDLGGGSLNMGGGPPAMDAPAMTAVMSPPVRQAMDALSMSAPDLSGPTMSSSAPSFGAAPTMPGAAPNQLLTDRSELDRLKNTGAGVDQIHNPLLRGVAKAGDIALSVFGGISPLGRALDMALPGTSAHHNYLVHSQQGLIADDQRQMQNDQQLADERAQQAQTQALTSYTQQRPAIEQGKLDMKAQIANNKNAAVLAPHGFIYSTDQDGNPTIAEDPNSQAYKDRVALSQMHEATADKDKITAEIAQNKYVPGTPEYNDAQRRLGEVDQRLQATMAGLGLRKQGLDLRRQNTQASLYGTDLAGNALPGAPQIAGDDGAVTTVGSKNAGYAIAQQASVGSFKDLSGSLTHARAALQDYFNEGGSLADPRMAAALSDPQGVTSQVIHGWVQAGMSPRAVAALTALKQYHEQAGILRGATKGTASEAGAQRILETAPGAGDANDVALSKLDEGQNVIDRLTPGVTTVSGGLHVVRAKTGGGGGGGAEVWVRDASGRLVPQKAGK